MLQGGKLRYQSRKQRGSDSEYRHLARLMVTLHDVQIRKEKIK